MPSISRLRWIVSELAFYLLIIINMIRLFRHAMWRDELQDFLLAAASSSPFDLYLKLKYEGHPGLWHLVLWVITRFTIDPVWMQVAHLCIALGIWLLIWRASPFTILEKFLLLLSYYLFWEYFIVSRSYAIGVLLGFGFVTIIIKRPEQRFWPFVLLGLLANTSVFAAIWAIGMGVAFAFHHRSEWRSMISGAAACALLFALAVATMMPAPDIEFATFMPSFKSSQLAQPLHFAIGAYVPLFRPFVGDALKWIGGWGSTLGATPFGRDPTQQIYSLLGGDAVPQLLAILALAIPLFACWVIVRDRILLLEFALIYGGILLFAQLSQYPFSPRHFGFVFVAFVGVVWLRRSLAPSPGRTSAVVLIALLAINALGGLTSLSDGVRPYSQSRKVAEWFEKQHLEDAFIMGAQDYAASPISGYLERRLYYLNCNCFSTYIEWSSRRQHSLNAKEIVARAAKGMANQNQYEAYLIVNSSEQLQRQLIAPDLTFEQVHLFRGATVGSENYIVYRVTRRS